MSKVISRVQRFLTSEDGPTAVEYAVLMGLIVVALVAVTQNLAKSISGTFSSVSGTLSAATTTSSWLARTDNQMLSGKSFAIQTFAGRPENTPKCEVIMRQLLSQLRRFISSEDGPTAVEYAVMVGLIAAALAASVPLITKSISGTFATVSSTLGSWSSLARSTLLRVFSTSILFGS
jgi:pilus assembly protein Flp/PilA